MPKTSTNHTARLPQIFAVVVRSFYMSGPHHMMLSAPINLDYFFPLTFHQKSQCVPVSLEQSVFQLWANFWIQTRSPRKTTRTLRTTTTMMNIILFDRPVPLSGIITLCRLLLVRSWSHHLDSRHELCNYFFKMLDGPCCLVLLWVPGQRQQTKERKRDAEKEKKWVPLPGHWPR